MNFPTPDFFNSRLEVEKSGVGKFIVEKSGVERSEIEAWGWNIRGWNVLQPFVHPLHQCWRIPCNANTLPRQRHKHMIPTLVLWSIVYLGIAVREITFLPFKIFMQNMVLCPSRVGFLTGKLGSNVPTNPITITRIFPHWPMEQI